MRHFRAGWVLAQADENGINWDRMYDVDADTEEEAKQQFDAIIEKNGEEITDFSMVEMKPEHLIAELKYQIESRLMNLYLSLSPLAQESPNYGERRRYFQTNTEQQLSAWRGINRYLLLVKWAQRLCDFTEITAKQLGDALKQLWEMDDEPCMASVLTILPKRPE